jgi:L-seryl-tRNA(Ser) seleniumtransferase
MVVIAKARELPRVDSLLESGEMAPLIEAHGRDLVRDSIRAALDWARQALKKGPVDQAALFERVQMVLQNLYLGGLEGVINGTGVVIHTNLGRAPLSQSAMDHIAEVSMGPANLEMDLDTGKRGKRGGAVPNLLCALTGAEDGFCVNNNAAAVLLALSALGKGGEVLVSRGELVEIGGSFRMPDIMELSGCALVEVGTTNRTRVSDFKKAVRPGTRAVMRVHRSNFHQVGFVESPELSEICASLKETKIPVIVDLGHGAVSDLGIPEDEGLPGTVQGCLEAGADLVLFSGDKLLGGPQAGIIVGHKEYVQALKKDPLHRVLRADKMTLAALESVLADHLAGRFENIPVMAAISLSAESLELRAQSIKSSCEQALKDAGFLVDVQQCSSAVGGGSSANFELPSYGLSIRHEKRSSEDLLAALRGGTPRVIARIHNEELTVDLRTVTDDEALTKALEALAISTL